MARKTSPTSRVIDNSMPNAFPQTGPATATEKQPKSCKHESGCDNPIATKTGKYCEQHRGGKAANPKKSGDELKESKTSPMETVKEVGKKVKEKAKEVLSNKTTASTDEEATTEEEVSTYGEEKGKKQELKTKDAPSNTAKSGNRIFSDGRITRPDRLAANVQSDEPGILRRRRAPQPSAANSLKNSKWAQTAGTSSGDAKKAESVAHAAPKKEGNSPVDTIAPLDIKPTSNLKSSRWAQPAGASSENVKKSEPVTKATPKEEENSLVGAVGALHIKSKPLDPAASEQVKEPAGRGRGGKAARGGAAKNPVKEAVKEDDDIALAVPSPDIAKVAPEVIAPTESAKKPTGTSRGGKVTGMGASKYAGKTAVKEGDSIVSALGNLNLDTTLDDKAKATKSENPAGARRGRSAKNDAPMESSEVNKEAAQPARDARKASGMKKATAKSTNKTSKQPAAEASTSNTSKLPISPDVEAAVPAPPPPTPLEHPDSLHTGSLLESLRKPATAHPSVPVPKPAAPFDPEVEAALDAALDAAQELAIKVENLTDEWIKEHYVENEEFAAVKEKFLKGAKEIAQGVSDLEVHLGYYEDE